MTNLTPKIICVVGATASGKTDYAIHLAKQYNTEIVSADSRQVFRELNIGTAKPSQEQLLQVPHHFINTHSVTTLFSAGDFERQALQLLQQLFAKHQTVIVCGGTGLYIKALCEGLDDLPQGELARREELNNMPIAELQSILLSCDPLYYYNIDIENKQRLVRAIEVYEQSGKPISYYLNRKKAQRNFEIEKIALNVPRQDLYNRINERVDTMMAQGLLDEVKQNINYRNCNALKTVGYTELLDYLDGKCTLDFAIDKIKQHTRNYAKRQLTWFKADEQIRWLSSL